MDTGKHSHYWLGLTAAIAIAFPLALAAQSVPPALHVEESGARLTFPSGQMRAVVPVVSDGALADAQVSTDLLDSQDKVRSHGTASCHLAAGTTPCVVTMPEANPGIHSSGESPANFRLRYTVASGRLPVQSGILAVDHIAPELFVVHLLAPTKVQRGGVYSVRIRATHPLTHLPRAALSLDVDVIAAFEGTEDDRPLRHTRIVTDARGFATVEFTAPSAASLDEISIAAGASLANMESSVEVKAEVPEQQALDLRTDKPLYQPGQTAHLRMLTIDRQGHARRDAEVTVDVMGPDSTLVFRTRTKTSRFGIATADWVIPARLRLGDYVMKAQAEDAPSAQTQVRVSRYDLPTFTVTPKPDKPFYLPGQNASVEVRADYLFGKPVLHGHVRVVRQDEYEWNFEAQKYDSKEGAVYAGELDADGKFTAQVDLAADEKAYSDPKENRFTNEFTDLHLAAYVTDASTGRTEQRRFDLRITPQPLHGYLIPDEYSLGGLKTGFYVSVTTADGLPAAHAQVSLQLLPRESTGDETRDERAAHAVDLQRVGQTDKFGLVRLEGLPSYEELQKLIPPPVHPSDADDDDTNEQRPELLLTMRGSDGNPGRATVSLEEPTSVLAVTTDHALYKPGDPIELTVTSAQNDLPVNIAVMRTTHTGDQTLFTQNVTLRSGHATLTVNTGTTEAPDPRFSGYVSISAVALGAEEVVHTPWNSRESVAAAYRTILFPRDNSLHVDVKMARATYRPGEMAAASVSLEGPQDLDGEDKTRAQMALGVTAVDQAVIERNRSDNEFGYAYNSFLFPWRWLFPQQHSVAGLTLGDLERLDPAKAFTADLDRAATVLLETNLSSLQVEDDAPSDAEAVYQEYLRKQLQPIGEALQKSLRTSYELPVTIAGLDAILSEQQLSISALRDPWGRPYRLLGMPQFNQMNLMLVSDGPDKLPGTEDDIQRTLISWAWFQRDRVELVKVVDDFHARSGGFVRDLAALTAGMDQDHVDFAAWRDPWGQPFTWRFEINGPNYCVVAMSQGAPLPAGHARRHPVEAGSACLSWFLNDRVKVESALNAYSATHEFPRTQADLDAALAAAGLSLGELKDAWGHPLYASFRTRSIYTDHVRVEARARAGDTPQTHTILTPTTEVIDSIDLRSVGLDGVRGQKVNDYDDDFVAGSFTRVRTQQAAKDAAPKTANTATTQSDEYGARTGAIGGTIEDASGAVIRGAKVVATNLDTQTSFEGTTQEDGTYLLSDLPGGIYTLTVTAAGFQTTIYDEVQVLSPDTTTIDAMLQVGAATETVTVTDAPPMLGTSNATLGSIGMRAIQGKNVAALSALMPGMAESKLGTPRLREYFPETLLWRPEVLTSDDGHATIRFPVADSITAWQLSVAASTLHGNTGSGSAAFQSFLPFFAALDPPQTLTAGDRIALPVTLRNYLSHAVTVRSELAASPWLRIQSAPGAVEIPAQDSAAPVVDITAASPVIDGKLRFTARPNGAPGDAIERNVTVHPNGQEFAETVAGVVTGSTTFEVTIPDNALPDGNHAQLKFYPNLPAHLLDAIKSLEQYPGDCAEQIMSTSWPSLLLSRYATKIGGEEGHTAASDKLKLESAYAGLLADRDGSSGGFRYWHDDPRTDLALTAYAVQFLNAAKNYIGVDDDVITQAVAYLAKQQSASGLWMAVGYDGKPHPENANGNAMLTASIAALIAGAPNTESIVKKALDATQPFVEEYDEPYSLANYALAAMAEHDDARSKPAIARLRSLALTENGGAYWKLETNTPFFGWGRAGRVESSAAALQALLAAGADESDDLVARGMLFLDHEQDRSGLWYSTQATARALDVMASIVLKHSAGPGAQPKDAMLAIRVDGQPVSSIHLPDPGRAAGPLLVDLGAAVGPGTHKVTLDAPAGMRPATAQIVANHYQPWPVESPQSATVNNEQLRLTVAFDNTSAAPGAVVHAKAHVERVGFRGYGMLMAELGLPPGVEVDRASLDSAGITHYEVLPDKLVVYLWPQAGGMDVNFNFSLRYRVDALTAPSTVYDYYNPDAHFDVPPVRFTSLQ